MLCAKNLKVALAAILGVVSLVGASTAHATINLNPGTAAAPNMPANMPQYFAAERLFAMSAAASVTARTETTVVAMAATTTGGYNVVVPAISAGFTAADGTLYVRFDLLTGNATTGSNDAKRIAFEAAEIAGLDPVIYDDTVNADGDIVDATVQATGTRILTLPGGVAVIYALQPGPIPAGVGRIEWALPEDAIKARVGSPTEAVTYYIRMSIWASRTDASAARFAANGGSAAIWAGGNAILSTASTLTTSVSAPQEITATVASGFRRFAAVGTTSTTRGKLATVTVAFQDEVRVGTAMHDILDHSDGMQVVVGDVLDQVQATVTGDNMAASYNFGEFYLDADCAGTDRMTRTVPEGTADTADRVHISTGLTRNLAAAGSYMFCANVTDNTEEQMRQNAAKTVDYEPYMQIEPVAYTITLATKLDGYTPLVDSKTLGAGEIIRDGTVVRIAYLTTATSFGAARDWQGGATGAYNQRLVMVNHSSADVGYELGDFATEEGVTVEATAMATGMLAANSSLVLRVRDLIEIMGGGRTSGKLTLVADDDDISVAMVQVTLPEGQTDTVRYHPQ